MCSGRMSDLRPAVCVCVLCGLPAAGKSTFTHLLSDLLHKHGWKTFIISYDEFIPDQMIDFSLNSAGDEEEESSKQESVWKQHRQALLECLEGFLRDPSTCTVTQGDLGERFQKSMEKQQIISASQNTQCKAKRIAVLLDDNNYYQSMRYQVFQLARKHAVGFCQLYLQCPLEVCLHRNKLRGHPVADHVIVEMSSRLEPPNTQKNHWEKNSVTVCSTEHISDTHMQILLQLISLALENPPSPPQDDSEQRNADRERCASSVVHQVDQVCRKLITQTMHTARGNNHGAQVLKTLAKKLSELKNRFLQEVRAQVLQELGQNECLCVDQVMNIATTTFQLRIDDVITRLGVN